MHLRPFEIVLIGIFAVCAIGGLIYLANYSAKGENEYIYGARVVLWGTFDSTNMAAILNDAVKSDRALSVVQYVQKDPRSFTGELLNAIAEGKSPDLIVLPHTQLVTYRAKLTPLSYVTEPEQTFRDTYIDGAEIFVRGDGVYGIPFAVDPLIMYWNRDIFSSAGLPNPPRTWESLVSESTPAIVKKTESYELSQSAVSFGEYANVLHAKEILSMLFFQAGSTMVEERGTTYFMTMNDVIKNGRPPAEAVLSFYTQFVSPTNDAYSWNRAQPLDRTQFLGGALALYFGLGSEIKNIERDNPNLNFDIAPIPQGSGATVLRNYGTFYAFAIPRASQNQQGAYLLAHALSNETNGAAIANAFGLAPVRRSLYGTPGTNRYSDIIRQSALIARGWLDPSPNASGDILRRMIEEVTSGRARVDEVINDAMYSLQALFK